MEGKDEFVIHGFYFASGNSKMTQCVSASPLFSVLCFVIW